MGARCGNSGFDGGYGRSGTTVTAQNFLSDAAEDMVAALQTVATDPRDGYAAAFWA